MAKIFRTETAEQVAVESGEAQVDADVAKKTDNEEVKVADKRESRALLAMLHWEERRALELEDESFARELRAVDLGAEVLDQDDLIDAYMEIYTKARRKTGFYRNELGKINLWLATEFLSSMQFDQFAVLASSDKIRLIELIAARYDEGSFEELFPDEAIIDFLDENDNPLRGGRTLTYTEALSRGEAEAQAVLTLQKQKLRDGTLAACEKKMRDILRGAQMRELERRSESVCDEMEILREIWMECQLLPIGDEDEA